MRLLAAMLATVLMFCALLAAALVRSPPAIAVRASAQAEGAPAPSPNVGEMITGPIPVRYQQSTAAIVYFFNDISVACGRSGRPDRVILACVVGNQVAMPNPCLLAEREYYARLLCHELAHVNGWPATHGE